MEKIIRIEEHSQEKEVMTFSYEYDNQGNWMLRYEYINDKRTGITERVITYYE